MSEVTYRRAVREDGPRIRGLLVAAYDDNPKSQAAMMDWQYWDNPFGEACSWIAERDGELVSHWAAVPVPVQLDGEPSEGAKGVDIATHPNHQRQGIFRRLAGHLVDDCRQAGLQVLLSHPNPLSFPGVQAVGGVVLGRALAYVRPLDDHWVARRFRMPVRGARVLRRRLFRCPQGDSPRRHDQVPDGLDELWQEVRPHATCGIVRNDAWWQWRYAQRPSGSYVFVTARRGARLTGAAALTVGERFGGRFGLVLEFLAVDQEAARGLSTGLAEAAAEQDAVGLALIGLPGARLTALSTAAGFRRLPRRLEPRPMRVCAIDAAGGLGDLTARRWTMAWGDLDHV